jgi:putative phosphoribosyl transferase
MFTTRQEAGVELARALGRFAAPTPIVLALPRGGLPIGRVIAQQLSAPLDVLIVRKLGAPQNPEFAIGAVGEGGIVVLDDRSIADLGLSGVLRDRVISEALSEVDRRVETYRRGRPVMDVKGKSVIIVDDGLATGATAEAAVRVVTALGAGHVVLAVPTGSRQAVDRLASICDEVVCLEIPEWFGSVGSQYESFPQVSDDEVVAILGA